MHIQDRKQELRKELLNERNNLGLALKRRYDDLLNQRLIYLANNSPINVVHVFLPMKSEPNIYPFIEHLLNKGLEVICPKSLPRGIMENYPLKSIKDVKQGIYGTSYPSNSTKYDGDIDLIVVPGLAYTIQKDRLGYGGGYYDRFLKNQKNALKIAPAYNFQIVKYLPTSAHDIKIDQIVLPD